MAAQGPSNQPLWRPTDPDNSMDTFRRWVEKEANLSLPTYASLHRFSIDRLPYFWELVWRYTDIISSAPYTSVLDESIPMDKIPKWFEGARLNWAENMLRCRRDAKVALIEFAEPPPGEEPQYKRTSFASLYLQVAQLAEALKKRGVGPGDVVGAYGPNCSAIVVAMLATTAIGAIWSSMGADFGPAGVLDRLEQISPKVLFTCNAVRYNGKVYPQQSKLSEVISGLRRSPSSGSNASSLVTVVINYIPEGPQIPDNKEEGLLSWEKFLDEGKEAREVEFWEGDFDAPLWVLFSSGTTGKPKAIVHRAGGMLLQSRKEHVIHGGMTENDVFFYFTTPAWMMMNYLVSGLSTGATLVLFEGSPLYDPSLLWRMSSTLGVTIFGASAKYLDVLARKGYCPGKEEGIDLRALKQVLSTGSPLKGELFDWVYENVKKDLLLGSITGGTDICSLFAGHNTSLPVYRSKIQCLNLGMALSSFSDSGTPVPRGEAGDLVCVKPFPCMPREFWRDEGGEKYRKAYFERFEGVWHHGDYVVITEDREGNGGGVIMQGRSDGVLNPQGIRFGSSELYECLEELNDPSIEDSLVVGQPNADRSDERVVMFLQMKEAEKLGEELVKKIKTFIRSRRSPRHVPEVILQVSQIPYTVNNKKVEVPVKKLLSGSPISSINAATLRNPECLDEYVKHGETLRKEV